jgi:hypothetical protein
MGTRNTSTGEKIIVDFRFKWVIIDPNANKYKDTQNELP